MSGLLSENINALLKGPAGEEEEEDSPDGRALPPQATTGDTAQPLRGELLPPALLCGPNLKATLSPGLFWN